MTTARTKLISAYAKNSLAGEDTSDDRELIEAYNNVIETNGKFPKLRISDSDIRSAIKRATDHDKAVRENRFDIPAKFAGLHERQQ